MKIGTSLSNVTWPRTGESKAAPQPSESNPWSMDLVQLDSNVRQSYREARALEHKSQNGHQLALVGMGAIFASLAVTVGASVASGGHGLGAATLPLMLSTGAALTTFSVGLWQRESNQWAAESKRQDADILSRVRDHRQETELGMN